MMLSKLSKYIMLLTAAAISSAAALAAAPTLAEADSAYSRGEYTDAIAIYEKIVAEKGSSSPMLCNLANAYVKAGDYGHAMLNYQRALIIDPSNSEARSNADYVAWRVQENNKAEVKGKKVSSQPDDPSFFQTLKRWVGENTASDTWAVWAAVCFVLFVVCAALYFFVPTVIVRKIGFFGGGSLLALSLIFVVFSFYAANCAESQEEGVIMAYKTNLFTEPSVSAKTNPNTLTRGTVMRVLDSQKGAGGKTEWYKVRFNSDFVGWIQADNFETVNR